MSAPAPPAATGDIEVDVCIVGSGFSGLGMAIHLKREGRRSFVVLEKAASVGGTWRENTYPGCACDISSHLYSFSFAPKPDWSRMYPTQPEIRDYLEDCATRFDVRDHMRFHSRVERADYDAVARVWRVKTADGSTITAQALVSGMGGLHKPQFPDLPGLDKFKGPAFHSALWDHSVDLTGKTVAVIGTGASAIQFVPQIQPKVKALHLYQRTPPWIVPKQDFEMADWTKKMFATVPVTQGALRRYVWTRNELLGLGFINSKGDHPGEKLAREHIAAHIPDPALREKLTPTFKFGCKRVLISNDYYPAVAQQNVELVTQALQRINAEGVVTSDGSLREADVIIYGTGFRPFDVLNPTVITGRDGRILNDDWKKHPEAFLGITVSGYPNFFMLMGPNTGLGHNSMIYMIESQIQYIMDALRMLDARGVRAMDVKADRQKAFNTELDQRLGGTVWSSGCKSWYMSADGKNPAIWPGLTGEYRKRTKKVDEEDYAFL